MEPNIFENIPIATKPQESRAIIEVEEKRAIAEIQGALIIAKKFPRDPVKAMDRILTACTRPTLAEHALYQYARGGSDITGPSIRLAEVVAQNWGNLVCGVVELARRDSESDCMSYAWDLETNFRDEKRFTVKHVRSTKKGTYRLEDERDIYENIANQGARRKRACLIAVTPGDVMEEAMKQVELTLKTKANVTPERIAALLEKFAEHKVTKDMIEKRIQRRIDAITPALIVNLGKIYNSLKDSMSTSADWFEIVPVEGEQKPDPAESLKDKLKKQKKADPAVPETESRFDCPNGGFVTLTVCSECKDREPKEGDFCPAYRANSGQPE